MEHTTSAHGLWGPAILDSRVFIIVAFSVFKPNSPRDLRTYVNLARQEERWPLARLQRPGTRLFPASWHPSVGKEQQP